MQPLSPEKSESALIAALSLLVPGSRVMDSGVVERTGAVAQVSKGGSWDRRPLLLMHGASRERHNRTKIMNNGPGKSRAEWLGLDSFAGSARDYF